MFNPLEAIRLYKNGKKFEEKFYQGLQIIDLAIFRELLKEYEEKMDESIAKVFAGQTMNYMTGINVEYLYKISEEPLKSQIGAVKNNVKSEAIRKIEADKHLREVIVHTLFFRDIIEHSHHGKRYLESDTKKQIDFLLNKFSSGIKLNVDSNQYLNEAKVFYKNYQINS
jgi:hypothetical protein